MIRSVHSDYESISSISEEGKTATILIQSHLAQVTDAYVKINKSHLNNQLPLL